MLGNDRMVVLFVVVALAILGAATVVGSYLLINNGKDAGSLLTLAGTAIGALASILATTRTNAPPPPPPGG